jgi:hypothetical protein
VLGEDHTSATPGSQCVASPDAITKCMNNVLTIAASPSAMRTERYQATPSGRGMPLASGKDSGINCPWVIAPTTDPD